MQNVQTPVGQRADGQWKSITSWIQLQLCSVIHFRVPCVQNPQPILDPYTFLMLTLSSLLDLVFMLRIHTNAKAHDTGDATREYPPYLIKFDSE